MIGVAAFLLLVALGLLAGGLAEGSAALQWGSFAASALAALTLAVGEVRRKRSARVAEAAREPARAEPARAEVGALVSARAEAAGRTAAPLGPGADPVPAEPAPVPEHEPADGGPVRAAAHSADDGGPATGAHAAAAVRGTDGEPPVEEVEVTDLLLVLDLTDEVLVVDEHPRYHVAGCPHLDGVDILPLRMDEARTDGFTPCGTCAPDHVLAERERARRS